MENKTLASAHKPIKVLDGTVMWIICAVVIVLFYALGFSGVLSNNNMRYLFKIFLYITMGSMWNLMSGFTGMTSLGQQVFVGIAGYSVAVMTTTYKMPFWSGLLAGAVITVIFALLLSFVLFRMSGMYFAVVSTNVPFYPHMLQLCHRCHQEAWAPQRFLFGMSAYSSLPSVGR